MILSDKPSEAIRQALEDLEKVEKDDRYAVDMGTWHLASPDGRCHVCLAGAVMAMTGRMDVGATIRDVRTGFPMDVVNKLFALDSFRSGDIHEGLIYWGHAGRSSDHIEKRLINIVKSHDVCPYHVDHAAFKEDVEKIARYLEEYGL
jgi:hypothetical protein